MSGREAKTGKSDRSSCYKSPYGVHRWITRSQLLITAVSAQQQSKPDLNEQSTMLVPQ